MANKYNRRHFLQQLGLGCASVGATTLLSSITNLGLINSAAAANSSIYNQQNDYKALVCIMLAGGNDSFNMLVPRGVSEYEQYATTRTISAIPQTDLLPITPINSDGKEYGLHPNLTSVKSLFDEGNLAFVSNIGSLVQPTNLSGYNSDNNLPKGLYSHSDQQIHWQTSVPNDGNALGWGGRMADILRFSNTNQNISMNISLEGVNRFQSGQFVQPYSITSSGGGAVSLNNATSTNAYEILKRQSLESLLEVEYANALDKAYNQTIKDANANSFEFSGAINAVADFNTVFDDSNLSKDLSMVAKTIASRGTLSMNKQIFFVSLGGWDTHFNTIDNHATLVSTLDSALKSFYDVLVELGVENNVTTFTVSDFGRKLQSNGSGNDHGWGGNVMVMGGSVNGQNIYGEYPELYVGSSLDTGGGRIIPTTSCDEYFAELAMWYGASHSDLYQILPNIGNFWTPNSITNPIGFMS